MNREDLAIGQLEFYWNAHLWPLGPPKGSYFAGDSMLGLVVHVSREAIHHGAEICLLRDLYRAGVAGGQRARV